MQVLVATSIADEGLDLPTLDTVVLATPTSSVEEGMQRIGRALWPHRGKQAPEVWDLVEAHQAAHKAAEARDALCVKEGWSIEAEFR